MKPPSAPFCLALAFACALATVSARVSHAAPVFVPDDFPTIQQAVDAADTVHVRPGVYHERPRLPGNGRPHLLRSYPSSGLVVLDGMTFDGALQGTKYKVQGIEFVGTVALETHDQLIGLTFERCRLDSGLVQTAYLGMTDWDELALRRCRLHGDLSGTFNYVFLEDDTLLASSVRLTGYRGARVLRCVFDGPGEAALTYTGSGIVRAHSNVIQSYGVGIRVRGYDSDIEALDNTIAGCPVAGIQLIPAHRVTLSRNRILDCGLGIFADASHDVTVTDNRIYRSTGIGISTSAHNRRTTIAGNVVGRSGGAGIVTRDDSEGAIEGNTSYANQDHGFALGIDPRAPVSIRSNLAYGNSGFGLSVGPGSGVQIGCNDWFANAGGNVLGMAPGATDLAADPLFCDLGSDSVGLSRQSVLLDVPGCGTIGALGAACGGPSDPSPAGGVAVTPCESFGWTPITAGGGIAAVTAAHPHPTGSLELRRAAPGASAAFARANPNADPLATLSSLAIALYREEGGSAALDAAPAVRLAVENPHGERSTLIWEASHNGLAVFPTGQWSSHDLSQGFFWQRAESPQRMIDRYDRRLADWLAPGTIADADGDVSIEVGPDARVVGYEIGTVDGAGDFSGAADDFRIAFGPRDTTFQFERTPVVAVELTAPQPLDCGSLLLRVRIDPPGVSGPVAFRDSDTVIGVVNAANIGAAWLTARDLTVGTHRFSASFGAGDCVVRSPAMDHVVNSMPTAITLASDRNPARLGDWVAFTARLSSTYPTGVVKFRDNDVPVGTVSVATGVATWTGVLTQGTHRMTVVYGGDHCHGSASAALTQIIGPPPVVSVSDLGAAPERNDGPWVANFLLALDGPSRDTVTVDFATRDGSATVADLDYQSNAGTARFLPGQTQTLVPFGVIGDVKPETDETLTLALVNPTIAVLGDSIGVGTLIDDDRPVITFGNYSPVTVEGTGDTTNVVFYVSLQAAYPETITVDYETADGTATAVQDYLPLAGTLSYAPGDRVREVSVAVLGDSVREATEDFRLVLSSVKARIVNGTTMARIRDNDLIGPNVSIDDASVAEGDSAGTVLRFRVWLSRPDGRSVRVTYGVIDSTAKMDLDYESKFGSIEFPPMVTEMFVEVPVLGDGYCEDGDETFLMRISNPVDAEIVRSRGVGTIVDDDCIPLTLLRPFTAEIVPDGVALRWQLNAAALSASVERSDSPAGPWAGIATGAVVTDGTIAALDRTAQPKRSYWYRLVARSTSNTVSRFGPIEVITPEHMPEPIYVWALGRVAPNPSPGSTAIEFVVASGGPVRLEILDVQGRRVALLADGAYPPGAHVAVWDGGSERGAAEAGLYFVRFRAAGRTWIHRLARVR